MNGILILNPSFQTTIQDLRRENFRDIGLCEAGALDEISYHQANILLGNMNNESVLEIALGGLEFEVKGEIFISLCGARAKSYINGKEIDFYRTYRLKDKDRFKMEFCKSGQMSYLGVKGGFDIKKTYGSASTSIKEKIGGLDGRVLKKGDFLHVKHCRFDENRFLKKKYKLDFSKPLTLRLVEGYQCDDFSKKQKEAFYENEYIISPQSNRMAYKLEGKPFKMQAVKLISEPIAYGAVQITPVSQLIVLLKERQTIGGYPKIGSVIFCDCFALGQKRQGEVVRFEKIELESARELCIKYLKGLKNV